MGYNPLDKSLQGFIDVLSFHAKLNLICIRRFHLRRARSLHLAKPADPWSDFLLDHDVALVRVGNQLHLSSGRD